MLDVDTPSGEEKKDDLPSFFGMSHLPDGEEFVLEEPSVWDELAQPSIGVSHVLDEEGSVVEEAWVLEPVDEGTVGDDLGAALGAVGHLLKPRVKGAFEEGNWFLAWA